jgi:hypothetical protein
MNAKKYKKTKNKLYESKAMGNIDKNNKILQFNIKLKDAVPRIENLLLRNIFGLKIFIGTEMIRKNRKKLNIICKNSIIFV